MTLNGFMVTVVHNSPVIDPRKFKPGFDLLVEPALIGFERQHVGGFLGDDLR